jgi:hypothetical protein
MQVMAAELMTASSVSQPWGDPFPFRHQFALVGGAAPCGPLLDAEA